MSVIDDIIQFNTKFVESKEYIPHLSEKIPKKKLAILSCMDTRLTQLLPAALNIKNGEAKIIKNAGAIISHPYGSVMRSLLVAVYNLGVRDIMVIGHTDCGMEKLNLPELINKMEQRGISPNIENYEWLRGFDNTNESIMAGVNIIKNHPLMPKDITVRGFLMDINTGKINEI
ncbi:MAG: carbonic anhydrase [Alphaproteobacteria bacterium]|nr:carbonic anhydrase [Alphaproteobacteria bacterium]